MLANYYISWVEILFYKTTIQKACTCHDDYKKANLILLDMFLYNIRVTTHFQHSQKVKKYINA